MSLFISGACVSMPWNENEGFVTLMIVHEDFRGKGIGKELFKRSVAVLGNRNVSLYSSPQAVPFYKKLGFRSADDPTYIYQVKFSPKGDAFKGELLKVQTKMSQVN